MFDAHLIKDLPDFKIDVAIKAAKGEVSVLFGPSGSGKTTCLDMIAGLAHPKLRSYSYGGKHLLFIQSKAMSY